MAKGRKTGGGSRAGSPNKATARARDAIAAFVDNNAERLQGWLDEIATEDGPKAAFECFKDLLEYHVPKLARHEHQAPEGTTLLNGTVVFVTQAPKPAAESER